MAVVGAGPAGLTAARVLADRGFKPVVFEHAAVTGGQLNLGDKPPGKDKIDWCMDDLESAAVRGGVEIRFNTEPSARDLGGLEPLRGHRGHRGAAGGAEASPGWTGTTSAPSSGCWTGRSGLKGSASRSSAPA